MLPETKVFLFLVLDNLEIGNSKIAVAVGGRELLVLFLPRRVRFNPTGQAGGDKYLS